jgi:ribosomal protein S18 acetylase RimI-like enzyme
MARHLSAALCDPRPAVTGESLEPLLLGPSRWGECFVASLRGKPVGYVLASRNFEAHTGKRQLRIADLFVAESARRSGTGRQLFATLLNRARSLGCQEVTWEVWKQNAAAYRFYERLGARHVRDVTLMYIAL